MLQPSAPLPGVYKRELLLPKWAGKYRSGAAEGLSTTEAFRPRLTSESYIFINFRLKKTRKQPHFEKILRGWRMARGALSPGAKSGAILHPRRIRLRIIPVFGRFSYGS